MNTLPLLLITALLAGCSRPTPAPTPDKPPAPQAGSAAAQLHAPLENARGVETQLEQSARTRESTSQAATQ